MPLLTESHSMHHWYPMKSPNPSSVKLYKVTSSTK
jgi:hypothetical protein